MQFLLSIIFGFFESIWRRWFGGFVKHEYFGKKIPDWFYKIIHSRGTQTIVNIIILTSIFLLNSYWVSTPLTNWFISLGLNKYILAIIMALIFQFMFWSKGHGPSFDIGRWDPEEYKERYKNVWFNKICEKIIPKKYWYGFLYDCIWMICRYAYGACFMIPFIWTFKILWLGLIAASVYAFCWTLYEKENWLFNKPIFKMASNPTQLAELINGFIVGFWLMWM